MREKYPKTIDNFKEIIPQKIKKYHDYTLNDITGANPNNTEFDNLFVDMNGIIDKCIFPENNNQQFIEKEMNARVMQYIDRLVVSVRPRKLLYLAVDDVTPQMKINKLRSQLYQTANEMEEKNEEIKATAVMNRIHGTNKKKNRKKMRFECDESWYHIYG